MIRFSCLILLAGIPGISMAQGDFEIPFGGELGYADLQPIDVAALEPAGDSPDLILFFGPEAIPVNVLPELVVDESGRIGGIVSLSWFTDDDTPRLLELPVTGRLRMRSRSLGTVRQLSLSEFTHSWDHALDVRAAAYPDSLRIVGHSRGESQTNPWLSREWTLEFASRVRDLGEARGQFRVTFGPQAVVRLTTTEGTFGAENTRLREWSGDAPLVWAGGEKLAGGTLRMETHFLEPESSVVGRFRLRAQNGPARVVVSGWLPVTYEEAALAVSDGTFDFSTLGLMPTNQLFATPAFTIHERLEWGEEFWDRGQVSLPPNER
jgi:hypothetical protein